MTIGLFTAEWHEGYEANEEGLDRDSNPYPEGIDRDNWFTGWDRAKSDLEDYER